MRRFHFLTPYSIRSPLVWELRSIMFQLFKMICERNPKVGKKYCSLFSVSWNIPVMPLISVSSFSIADTEHAVVCENCSSCTFNQHVMAVLLQCAPEKCIHLPCPCRSNSGTGQCLVWLIDGSKCSDFNYANTQLTDSSWSFVFPKWQHKSIFFTKVKLPKPAEFNPVAKMCFLFVFQPTYCNDAIFPTQKCCDSANHSIFFHESSWHDYY